MDIMYVKKFVVGYIHNVGDECEVGKWVEDGCELTS